MMWLDYVLKNMDTIVGSIVRWPILSIKEKKNLQLTSYNFRLSTPILTIEMAIYCNL
jgi:hypothetical protein